MLCQSCFVRWHNLCSPCFKTGLRESYSQSTTGKQRNQLFQMLPTWLSITHISNAMQNGHFCKASRIYLPMLRHFDMRSTWRSNRQFLCGDDNSARIKGDGGASSSYFGFSGVTSHSLFCNRWVSPENRSGRKRVVSSAMRD